MVNIKARIQKFRLKHTRAFWVDRNLKKWKAKDISDDYLKHIIYFISEGKGWSTFIHKRKRINRIFKEAYRRELTNFAGIFNLHQWALCQHGYSTAWPKYRFTWKGEFIEL